MADPFRNFIIVLALVINRIFESAGDAGGVFWVEILGDFAAHFWE